MIAEGRACMHLVQHDLALTCPVALSTHAQVVVVRQLYQKCRLVHADLSEYNILYHKVGSYLWAYGSTLAGHGWRHRL